MMKQITIMLHAIISAMISSVIGLVAFVLLNTLYRLPSIVLSIALHLGILFLCKHSYPFWF